MTDKPEIPAALREALDAPVHYPGTMPKTAAPSPATRADRARAMAAALRWAMPHPFEPGLCHIVDALEREAADA